eukprot:CAMPEP_0169118368 /NCGR_PEP_ID=MMETSP1015-20121227/30960_1 /TAXON_ID=342587 /ORGANISM="Karlodinium micrum, Strain CCMP2283" /LENGTH=63 /DNA_ID=CAMNT_0009181125 /DNA_START=374 /DNA_END=560 /DNA_ORIENTATION=+
MGEAQSSDLKPSLIGRLVSTYAPDSIQTRTVFSSPSAAAADKLLVDLARVWHMILAARSQGST